MITHSLVLFVHFLSLAAPTTRHVPFQGGFKLKPTLICAAHIDQSTSTACSAPMDHRSNGSSISSFKSDDQCAFQLNLLFPYFLFSTCINILVAAATIRG